MSEIQRYVILDLTDRENPKVIGTDSQKPFTQGAAELKLGMMRKARPKNDYRAVEIKTIWEAL
jgi:hypothetical protein